MKTISLRYPDDLDEALLKLADGIPRERYIRRLIEDHVGAELAKQVAAAAAEFAARPAPLTGAARTAAFRNAAQQQSKRKR
jgi:predicted transcriptional regulator